MKYSHTVWVLSVIVFLTPPGLSQSRKPPAKSLPPAYQLIVLPLAEASGINDNGQVVGIRYAKTAYVDAGDLRTKVYQSYVWQKGRLRSLGPASTHPRIFAASINSKGDIVGAEEDVTASDFPWTLGDAYLWSRGRKTALSSLTLHAQRADATFALGINNKGTIVGSSGMAFVMSPNDSDDWSHAVVWKRGKLTDLGWGEAKAINDRGQIVGDWVTFPDQFEDHAVLWDDGRKLFLGYGTANAINNHGQVVGLLNTGRAFLYDRGKTIDIGSNEPVAINDQGQVLLDGGYLWYQGKHYNLNHLVPKFARWSNIQVSGINNNGAIIGYGTYKNQERAFLLVPSLAHSAPRHEQKFSHR